MMAWPKGKPRPELRERMLKLNADPEFAARNAERMRKRHADPEFAARNAERMRKLHADRATWACIYCGQRWSPHTPLDPDEEGDLLCRDADACERRRESAC